MATRKKTTKSKVAKATVKRSVSKKSNSSNFWKIEFTISTVYWLILGAAVIATALFTYDANQKINEIYDQIDISTAMLIEL